MPKRAKRPGRKQSKSVWRAKKAILKKAQKVLYCRAKLEVRDALERHLEAKLELKMASKRAKRPARRQSKEHLESRKGNIEKSTKSAVLSSKIGGPGCSGEALGGQVGAQNGIQVRLGSSTWRPGAPGQPNLASKCALEAQLGSQSWHWKAFQAE